MTIKSILAAATLLVFTTAPAAAAQQAATQAEREAAIKYLEETRKAFLDSIDGLSEEQWKFKPGPDRWSVAEVAEHIALSEDTLHGLITTKILAAPAPPAERIADEKLIAGVTDRSQKAQAPEILRPVNKWATRDALVKDFNAARDRTIAWIRTTKEDLRAHGTPHPVFGPLDAHQWVLLVAGHSARHTAQIEEVKKSTGFPK